MGTDAEDDDGGPSAISVLLWIAVIALVVFLFRENQENSKYSTDFAKAKECSDTRHRYWEARSPDGTISDEASRAIIEKCMYEATPPRPN
jgi:uncharacterized membrane protein